jgi:hypothetical protein
MAGFELENRREMIEPQCLRPRSLQRRRSGAARRDMSRAPSPSGWAASVFRGSRCSIERVVLVCQSDWRVGVGSQKSDKWPLDRESAAPACRDCVAVFVTAARNCFTAGGVRGSKHRAEEKRPQGRSVRVPDCVCYLAAAGGTTLRLMSSSAKSFQAESVFWSTSMRSALLVEPEVHVNL